MSAPVQRHEETDDLQFYAPPWVRERAPTAAPDQPEADLPAASETDDPEDLSMLLFEAPDRPEGTDPPHRVTETAETRADTQTEELVPAAPQAKPAPRMAPGVGGPNIGLPTTPRTRPHANAERASATIARAQGRESGWHASGRPQFEGDVGIKALRHRMALDPEFLPTPPIYARPRPVLHWLRRLAIGIGGAAVIAFGIAMITLPENRPRVLKGDSVASTLLHPQRAAPQLAGVSIPVRPSPKLILEDRKAFTNEAIPLGISLDGAAGGEVAVLSRLVPGTWISAGERSDANGWRLPAGDLTQAYVHAPSDFTGFMEAVVDLRAANDVLVDSQFIRLEWLPQQAGESKRAPRLDREDRTPEAAPSSVDVEELATLMRRAREYLSTGDIAAARLVLRRAANAGNPEAALALGATFDPLVLGELGARGFPPDLAQAQAWYAKAARLGSPEAPRRIEALARSAP